VDRAAAELAALKMEREAWEPLAAPPSEDEARWFTGQFSSYVYFLQQGEGGPIKIGRAGAVGVRVDRLQTGSPTKLKLLCAVPGGGRLEAALQHAFAQGKMEGEWFKPTRELRRLIAELQEQWSPRLRLVP
jgi:hypothetical protein